MSGRTPSDDAWDRRMAKAENDFMEDQFARMAMGEDETEASVRQERDGLRHSMDLLLSALGADPRAQFNEVVEKARRLAAAPAAAEGGKMRTALAALETLATKQQKVELRDAAHRILHGYSPCMNCGKWTRTNECHWPCNPIKTIEPEPAPAADAEFEAAINAHEAATFAWSDIMHSCVGRKEINDAANALRALHARRIAEAEARGAADWRDDRDLAVDAARHMQKERDEMRQQCERHILRAGESAEKSAAAQKERDEARASLASFRQTFVRIIEAIGCPNAFVGDEVLVAGIQRIVSERDEARAEVERLRALDKEAKSVFAPWVQGPGIVGGILHLQEEVERLRARVEVLERVRKAADHWFDENDSGNAGSRWVEVRAALLAAKEGK